MRVLIGTMSYRPNVSGVAVFVEQLSQFLVERGHEVHIVAPGNRLKGYIEEDGSGVVIHRLRAYPNLLRRGFFLPLMVRWQVRGLVRQLKPDIIHVNDPMAMSRYLQYSGKEIGAPTIVSNHFTLDYVLAYFPKFLHKTVRLYVRQWLTRFYNRCDQIIAPSQSAANFLRHFGVIRPVRAISNGVDLHRFYIYFPLEYFRDKYHLPADKLVLYIGRVDKDKSIDVLFEAFKKVLATDRAHLVVVGGGSKAEDFIKLARKDFGDHVTFTGPVDHESDDLIALYQLADVFVTPSPIETQSISTMEAMAAGRAIIGANGGALPELIEDGHNGYLFEPGNTDELAEKIIDLLRDDKKRRQFGEESLELINRHELDQNLELYENLYHLHR